MVSLTTRFQGMLTSTTCDSSSAFLMLLNFLTWRVRVAYSLSEDTLMLSFDGGAEKGDITILLVAESKLNGCLFVNAEHGCDSMQTGAGRLDGEWRFLPCAYIGGELNCDSDGRERFIGFDVEPWFEDKNVEYRVGQKKEP